MFFLILTFTRVGLFSVLPKVTQTNDRVDTLRLVHRTSMSRVLHFTTERRRTTEWYLIPRLYTLLQSDAGLLCGI